MKTLIIGHTTGIGKAMYDILDSSVGISKSTGFDINIVNKMYDYSEYECIILNAYDKFTSQIKTMFDIIEVINKNTLVIVIASTSAYKTNPSDLYWAKYSIEKAAILKAGIDLNTMGYNICCISPGIVDTHRNKDKQCKKLPPYTIAETVKNVIDNYEKGILMEHIVIRIRK